MTDSNLASRRRFLQSAALNTAAFASGGAVFGLIGGCARTAGGRATSHVSQTLAPAIDPTTGKALLKLPPGFRYFSFGWAGDALATGGVVPPAADGMGLISYQNQRARFIRNQELWEDTGAFGPSDNHYDAGAGGGTVSLEIDLRAGKQIGLAKAGVTGTNANCSGGVMPWGTWLSGEEQVIARGQILEARSGRPMTAFTQPHGFMFEAKFDATARARPIVEMGQMRHEAAQFDNKLGVIYLTEDNEPEAGLYRFTPNKQGDLQSGGKLEVLAVQAGTQEFRRGVQTGKRVKTRWVEIPDPTRAHADDALGSNGCFMQGKAQGAAQFTRLEGIYLRDRELFFTATNGGDVAQGQIFCLHVDQSELELIYESQDKLIMNYPDAIYGGPDGGHIICQDGKEVFPQVLYHLSKTASVRAIAQINADAADSAAYTSEWSGCSMSPDGQWLFANVYTPGYSVAITGPFEQWARQA